MQMVRIFDVYAQKSSLDHGVNGVRKRNLWMSKCVFVFIASVCSTSTCQNGGTCRQIAPTMAECLCQTGFTGPTCNLRKFSIDLIFY